MQIVGLYVKTENTCFYYFLSNYFVNLCLVAIKYIIYTFCGGDPHYSIQTWFNKVLYYWIWHPQSSHNDVCLALLWAVIVIQTVRRRKNIVSLVAVSLCRVLDHLSGKQNAPCFAWERAFYVLFELQMTRQKRITFCIYIIERIPRKTISMDLIVSFSGYAYYHNWVATCDKSSNFCFKGESMRLVIDIWQVFWSWWMLF